MGLVVRVYTPSTLSASRLHSTLVMPKAVKKPASKRSIHSPHSGTNTTGAAKSGTAIRGPRIGKASHLYTDDNPATTLHGTGFKDAATANKTIDLVSKRSLTYQFQTINTMFHRAKHHPRSQDNENMQAAMAVFRVWLDETYPAAKSSQRDFKPVLSRELVENFAPYVRRMDGIDTKWMEKYIETPKGKRLANTLMDDAQPEEADLERYRRDRLGELADKRQLGDGEEAFWIQGEEKNGLSEWHWRCVSLAWSPVGEARLKRFL